MKNNIIKDLEGYTDYTDKLVQNYWKKLLKDFKFSSDVEIECEGPNIIFKTSTVQYKVTSMKFLPGTSHREFSNLLGCGSVVMEFKKSDDKDKIENKLLKGLLVLEALTKNNVFHKEDESLVMIN